MNQSVSQKWNYFNQNYKKYSTAQSGTKVTVQEKYKQINKERNMNMYLAFSYLVKTMTKES